MCQIWNSAFGSTHFYNEYPPWGHEGRQGFTMENIKIHINYLDVYAKQLSQLTNELLGMQDKYDVTADLDQIERLSSQLEQLKAVVDTLPLA